MRPARRLEVERYAASDIARIGMAVSLCIGGRRIRAWCKAMDETDRSDELKRSDEMVEALLGAAIHSGFTFDALEFLIRGLDATATAILLGNVSKLPVYMKSKDIPYLSRSRIAPSMEIRKSPLSHWE